MTGIMAAVGAIALDAGECAAPWRSESLRRGVPRAIVWFIVVYRQVLPAAFLKCLSA